MSNIRNIKLEILRPGPAHNQLLSPLTPYLALCGADGPVTIQQPFEQRQLLVRLNRLRYYIDKVQIVPEQRETELRDIGEQMGDIFGQVPSLLSELGSVRASESSFVHLRLSLSASELGLMPFETAIAPEGYPASGTPLFLQKVTPIVLTREARRGKLPPVDWNRPPRILFIHASPGNLAPVPAKEHMLALRRAIDPWLPIGRTGGQRLEDVKQFITVLPDASLEQVRDACDGTQFTHIHILAHGDTYRNAGDRRFGIVLCDSRNPEVPDIVDSERLAIALTSQQSITCGGRGRPSVLSLATCDSANASSVLTPGGSIAHELHAAGIPWIFASQFPLWMRASNIFAEILYQQLLIGVDPRCVLYELRQRLKTSCPQTHDWASIVVYATVPWNFENQVEKFRNRQMKATIDNKFSRLDELLQKPELKSETNDEIKSLSEKIRQELEKWLDESVSVIDAAERSRRLGKRAACEKRLGTAYHKMKLQGNNNGEDKKDPLKFYENARNCYSKALYESITNHWVVTQYLSMTAVIASCTKGEMEQLTDRFGDWWTAARRMSRWALREENSMDRAWTCATLAELEMLGAIYNKERFSPRKAKENVREYCREIIVLGGPDSFPARSTKRQFSRYLDIWKLKDCESLARAALGTLEEKDV